MNYFLRLLAETRDKYRWLILHRFGIRGQYSLGCVCPAEAVLRHVYGYHGGLRYEYIPAASKTLGLYEYQLRNIMKAADGHGDRDQGVFTQLCETLDINPRNSD